MDREVWHAAVHGITKSWTRLSDFTFTFKPNKSRELPFLFPLHLKHLKQCYRVDVALDMYVVVVQSFQFSSVTQSCLTLCDPMNCSTPSLPVHHQLSEFTQTHIHQVGDAIQPSHPLLSPFPPAPHASQNQSLFQ